MRDQSRAPLATGGLLRGAGGGALTKRKKKRGKERRKTKGRPVKKSEVLVHLDGNLFIVFSIRFINQSSLYGYRIDKSKHCLNRAPKLQQM